VLGPALIGALVYQVRVASTRGNEEAAGRRKERAEELWWILTTEMAWSGRAEEDGS